MKNIISAKPAPTFDTDSDQARNSRWILVATFIVPAIFVGGLLLLLVSFRGEIEAAVANLARLLPVGYALAAGTVAGVDPCGAVLLPPAFL